MRLLQAPLVHFLAGGAALFGLARALPPAAVADAGIPPPTIVITATDVAQMRDTYTRETGLQPTVADEVALINEKIEEELLFREARARGLDRNDRSVRNWLVEQMRILADAPDADEEELLAQAQALELDRKDLVVRRIVVQKMRLLASRAGEQDAGEDELRAFYELHREAYRQPDRISIWHVFVAAREGGGAARRRAEKRLAELRRGAADPAVAARTGDTFPLSSHLISQSRQQLEKMFGPDFTDEIARAPMRTWSGPFRSPYGLHLVWVESHERGDSPRFEAVRGQVLEAWHEESRAERLAALIRDLRSHTVLRVDSAAWRERKGAG